MVFESPTESPSPPRKTHIRGTEVVEEDVDAPSTPKVTQPDASQNIP